MRRTSASALSRRAFGMGITASMALLSFAERARGAQVKGKITGHQHLLNPVWTEARDPNSRNYTFREPSPTVSADMRRLFPYIPKEICIVALAAAAQGKMAERVVRVAGGRTSAVTLVVPPGTALKFTNGDPISHRLYAVDVPTFGASDMKPGADRVWTVPEAGVFEVRDELVPSVRMWVVGEPKVAALTFPAMDGSFQMQVDEPGDYTVQAYFSGKPVGKPLVAPVATPNATLNFNGSPIVVATPKKGSK